MKYLSGSSFTFHSGGDQRYRDNFDQIDWRKEPEEEPPSEECEGGKCDLRDRRAKKADVGEGTGGAEKLTASPEPK